MIRQPIPLTPEDVSVLIDCSLHYHFLQQKSALPVDLSAQADLDERVRKAIHRLHAAGGPARMSLDVCLKDSPRLPALQKIMTHYYQRLEQDWPRVMASNEAMALKISIAGVSLTLQATLDRLDRTRDGGILAILFRTQQTPPSTADDLRHNPAMTIYHALVASAYPLKRPVRLQELWLYHNEEVTIELSEDEYRHNLGRLREPVLGLARSEVMARPGLHCDSCPFKFNGCPVYVQPVDDETEPDDLVSSSPDGKMSPRRWIFKI
jgi:RecB family exonuclease